MLRIALPRGQHSTDAQGVLHARIEDPRARLQIPQRVDGTRDGVPEAVRIAWAGAEIALPTPARLVHVLPYAEELEEGIDKAQRSARLPEDVL